MVAPFGGHVDPYDTPVGLALTKTIPSSALQGLISSSSCLLMFVFYFYVSMFLCFYVFMLLCLMFFVFSFFVLLFFVFGFIGFLVFGLLFFGI